MKGLTKLQRNIRNLRENKGISIKFFSPKIGISISLIEYYEGRGETATEPSLENLKRYSNFFEISIHDLVTIDVTRVALRKLKQRYYDIQHNLSV